MRVRMLVKMSGLVDFGDGAGLREWPDVEAEVVVPDTEGADLCARGQAEPVAELPKPETRQGKA